MGEGRALADHGAAGGPSASGCASTSARDDRFDHAYLLDDRLREACASSCPPGALGGHPTFTFAAPPAYRKLGLGPASVGLLAWEATQWPPTWVAAADTQIGRVVVPAEFAAATLTSSGLDAGRIGVVRHGVDAQRYHPAARVPARSGAELHMLFVGTPARRKGLDALVAALEEAFPGGAGARLTVKMVPYADAAARPYLDPHWRERLARLAAQGMRVDVLDEVIPEDGMASLYRSADLLVHPFRGECFPMPFLEAMASGTPVLCTGWSGPPELITGKTGFLMPPRAFVPAAPLLPEPGDVPPSALMAEPAVADVAARLRQIAAEPRVLAAAGRRARQDALRWTWRAGAESLLRELRLAQVGRCLRRPSS